MHALSLLIGIHCLDQIAEGVILEMVKAQKQVYFHLLMNLGHGHFLVLLPDQRQIPC